MTELQLPILQSGRVSRATRHALRQRLEKNTDPDNPGFLSSKHLQLLRAIIATLLPQETAGTEIRIAEAIDRRLAEGSGIGWRFAELPADREAYQQGLQAVAEILGPDITAASAEEWESLPGSGREHLLLRLQSGDEDARAGFPLGRWMEVVRVDAVTIWLADPRAMLAIDYNGFADGDDGWTEVGLDHHTPVDLSAVPDSNTSTASSESANRSNAGNNR